jgi:hypothetical protein
VAQFDAKKFTGLDWTIVGCGGIAFIALFLPWYGVSVSGYSASVSGWSTDYGWLGALLILAAGIYMVAEKSADLSSISVRPAVIETAAAGLGTLIVIIRISTLPSGSAGFAGFSYSYGPSFGIFLALIAGLVATGVGVVLVRKPPAIAGDQATS